MSLLVCTKDLAPTRGHDQASPSLRSWLRLANTERALGIRG